MFNLKKDHKDKNVYHLFIVVVEKNLIIWIEECK